MPFGTSYMTDFMLEEYSRLLINEKAVKERVRWAINRVAKDYGMTNEKFAEMIGCATSTINSYRRKITLPGLEFFVIFLYKYSFRLDWFVKGEGEPFPGARDKYPEVCGPVPAAHTYKMGALPPDVEVQSPPASYDPTSTHSTPVRGDITINVHEATGKAFHILSSGTPYAVALYLNIQQFSASLDSSRELMQYKERLVNQQVQIDELRSQVDGLRRQVDSVTAVPTIAAEPDDSSEKEAM